jgi:hypothetical protein
VGKFRYFPQLFEGYAQTYSQAVCIFVQKVRFSGLVVGKGGWEQGLGKGFSTRSAMNEIPAQ